MVGKGNLAKFEANIIISEIREAMLTKIGANAFHINFKLHKCFGKQLFPICILIVWMEQVFINKINYCSSASNNNNNNNNNNVIGTWSNPSLA